MKTKRPSIEKCKFCNETVNLDDEGVTYRDGSCAHEQCDDNEQFRKENATELAEGWSE